MYACFIVANAGLTIITILMTTPECVMDAVRGWLAVGTIPAGISIAAIGPFLLQPAGGFWNLLGGVVIWLIIRILMRLENSISG